MWKPPPDYEPVESKVEGITVFAPRPKHTTVDDLKGFSCPKCGATTQFDVAAGGVACDYCGYVATIEAEQVGRDAIEFEFTLTTLNQARQGWGVVRRELHCVQCGADLTVPDGAITTTCPFCASNKVNVRTAPSDQLRPRFLAPFVVEPTAAQTHVRSWLGEGWMHPKQLQTTARIGHLTGIYLPFWTFDASVTSDWKAEVGYTKTERSYDRSAKSWKTRTRIEWRWEQGRAGIVIDDLLINGSSHVSERILARIYPFDLNQLVAYVPDFLAGWQAHSYDVSLTDAWETAKHMIRQQAKNSCYAQIRSSHVRNFTMMADFADESWRYILLPVYMDAYVFDGQVYQVMVNGQTGVVAGQKPVAWWKVWSVGAALALPGLAMVTIGAMPAVFPNTGFDDILIIVLLLGIILIVAGIAVVSVLYTKAMQFEAS